MTHGAEDKAFGCKVLLSEITSAGSIPTTSRINKKKLLTTVKFNRNRTVYPCGSNKGFGLR